MVSHAKSLQAASLRSRNSEYYYTGCVSQRCTLCDRVTSAQRPTQPSGAHLSVSLCPGRAMGPE